tara:strand:- start:2441 stop:2902 length:462 start_codon:yes stop_codon:yes gene_type:complete
MNLNLKSYKLLKTKTFIENNSFVLIFNKLNMDIKSESPIVLNNYQSYLIRSKLTKKILKNSILCNLNFLINGTVVLIVLKKKKIKKEDFNLKIITELKTQSLFVGLKLNNKLYSPIQLRKAQTLNYNENIKNFRNLLNFYLMSNSLKLKKISK